MTDALTVYGPLGIGLAAAGVAIRVLFARVASGADAERARADRHEDEVRKLNASIRTDILPVLVKVMDYLAEQTQMRERR